MRQEPALPHWRSETLIRFLRLAWTYRRAKTLARARSRWSRAAKRKLRPDGDAIGPAAGLFHVAWYIADNPDVATAGVDHHAHYAKAGWREGRDPNPLFDTSWYLAEHPEVAAASIDPLHHYHDYGWRKGWNPSPLFDTSWYLAEHPEVAAAGIDPLQQYLDRGVSDGEFVHPDHRRSVFGYGPKISQHLEATQWADVFNPSGRKESMPLDAVADFDAATVTFELTALLVESTPGAGPTATARRLVVAMAAQDVTTTVQDIEERRTTGLSDPITTSVEEIQEDLAAIVANLGAFDTVVLDGLLESLASDERERRLDDIVLSVAVSRLYHDMKARKGSQVSIVGDFDEESALERILADHGIDAGDVLGSTTIGTEHEAGHLHVSAADGAPPHATSGTLVVPRSASVRRRSTDSLLTVLRERLSEAAEVAVATTAGKDPVKQRVIRAAYGSSLLPAALVSAAIEAADRANLDTVHYMSREGWFLAQVHNAISDRLRAHRLPPRAVHLAVSRRSTFGPSLKRFDPESLMDLWRMYGTQSLRALIVSLGDKAERYQGAAHKYGIGLDEVVEGIHADGRVARFLSDADVSRMLGEHNAERRVALMRYLNSRWSVEGGRAIVVDVGWRGTIQDNLARLEPGVFLSGWYLALLPFRNPQPSNTVKQAVGPNGNSGDPFVHIEPPAAVERPWTRDVPSIVDYRMNELGDAVPVEEKEVLGHAQTGLIELFQDGAVRGAAIVAEWISNEGLLTSDLHPLVCEELHRYYVEPFGGVADLWFSLTHDDTFGVLNVTPFGKQRPSVDWFDAGLGAGFRERVSEAAADSLWTPGYLAWLPVASVRSLEQALRRRRFSVD